MKITKSNLQQFSIKELRVLDKIIESKPPTLAGTSRQQYHVKYKTELLMLVLLLNDVVDLDLTRQHINLAKDEMQKGGKVLLLRRGFVVTDQISGSITLGELAYFHVNGALTSATAYSGSTAVGRWLSKKDADGFAKVDINIV